MLVYFSGDWDVHWGTGFDPWPNKPCLRLAARQRLFGARWPDADGGYGQAHAQAPRVWLAPGTQRYGGWTKSISHHPRHHGKHQKPGRCRISYGNNPGFCLLVFTGNHQKPGFLRWCRISSIQSRTVDPGFLHFSHGLPTGSGMAGAGGVAFLAGWTC